MMKVCFSKRNFHISVPELEGRRKNTLLQFKISEYEASLTSINAKSVNAQCTRVEKCMEEEGILVILVRTGFSKDKFVRSCHKI